MSKPLLAKMIQPCELLGAGLKLETGDVVELTIPYNIPACEIDLPSDRGRKQVGGFYHGRAILADWLACLHAI